MNRIFSSILALTLGLLIPRFAVRSRTHDVSFTYRMGAGFPGDVNRTHPASIEPGLINTSVQVPRLYGDPCLVDSATNSYRGFVLADTKTTIDAIIVRPYPTQQTTGGMSASIGAATPPTSGVADFMTDGYMIAKCNNFGANPPSKGSAVFVWIAASSGNHVQGGLEAASGGASTLAITNATWNGPADTNGIAEIVLANVN